MRMLDDLEENLEEIESKNESHYKFITDMMIQKEEHPGKTLTGPQFRYLCDLHNKYC